MHVTSEKECDYNYQAFRLAGLIGAESLANKCMSRALERTNVSLFYSLLAVML